MTPDCCNDGPKGPHNYSFRSRSTDDKAADQNIVAGAHARADGNVKVARPPQLPGDLPAVPLGQIVETTVRTDVQIDRGRESGGKTARHARAGSNTRIQPLHKSPKKYFPR